MRRLLILLILFGAAGVGMIVAGTYDIGPAVITREGQQKLILFRGNPKWLRDEPGLSWRVPWLMTVLSFDSRLLYLSTEGEPIQTEDRERMIVDNYVVWRIADPRLFYASFPERSAERGVQAANQQIERVVRADLRAVIGQRRLDEVLTTARQEIMVQIAELSAEGLLKFGIGIEDVRINATELPAATEKNVFSRMRAERERLARKHRAEGEEKGQGIRAGADRDARIIVAEAERDAQILRGEGDAEAARIYAESFEKDPEFYSFLRTLEAYRKTIGEETTLVISPQTPFFQLLIDETFVRHGEEFSVPAVSTRAEPSVPE